MCVLNNRKYWCTTQNTHTRLFIKKKWWKLWTSNMDIQYIQWTKKGKNCCGRTILNNNKKYFLWIKIDVYVSMWLFFSNVIIQYFFYSPFHFPFFHSLSHPRLFVNQTKKFEIYVCLFFCWLSEEQSINEDIDRSYIGHLYQSLLIQIDIIIIIVIIDVMTSNTIKTNEKILFNWMIDELLLYSY